MGILFTVFLLLPPVQTYLAGKLSAYLKEHYDVDIRMEKLFVSPAGKVMINHVLAYDHHGDTLFYAGYLQTGLKHPLAIRKNRVELAKTSLEDAFFNLVTYKGETTDNFSVFLEKLEGKKSDSPSEYPFLLHIPEISLHGTDFVLHNLNVKPESIYETRNIEGKIKNFRIEGKNLLFRMDGWKFRDKYNLEVKHFSNRFVYTPDSMRIDNLQWETASSSVRGKIGFYYSRSQLRHFFDSVQVRASLRGTMNTGDLNKLAGGIFGDNLPLKFKGKFSGTVNQLTWDSMRMDLPENNYMQGKAILFHLTDLDNFGFRFNPGKAHITYDALKKFLPEITAKNIPAELKNLNAYDLMGNLDYTHGKLFFDGQISTAESALEGKVQLTDLKKIPGYFIEGRIRNFPAGKLLQVEDLGKITGEVFARGKSFDPARMQSTLKGSFTTIEYKNYPYSQVDLSMQVQKGKMEAKVSSGDPLFKIRGNGNFTLTGKKSYRFEAEITQADLYKTGWVLQDTTAEFSGKIKADFLGDNPDTWEGFVLFKNLRYVNSRNTYSTDSLYVRSDIENGEKNLRFSSDRVINGYIKGAFLWKNLPQIVKKAVGTVLHIYAPAESPDDAHVKFNLQFDNNFLQILEPRIKSTRHTRLRGNIDTGKDLVHVELRSDEVHLTGMDIYKPRFIIDNQNPIFNLFARADSVVAGNYPMQNIQAIHLNINDTVFFKTKFTGNPQKRDTFDVALKYHMDSLNNIHAVFLPGKIHVRNTDWFIDPSKHENRWDFYTANDSLVLENIALFRENQSVSIDGYDTPQSRDIRMDIKNLVMESLYPGPDPFFWEGVMNGHVRMGKYRKIPFYNADISITDFVLNGTSLGFFTLTAKSVKNEVVFLEASNRTSGFQTFFNATGFIDLNKEMLDISVTPTRFPLKIFDPVMKDVFNHVRGEATGHIRISGRLDNPQYTGSLFLSGAGLGINVLNTDYLFNDQTEVLLEGQKFVFHKTVFRDSRYNTTGLLDGYISFYNFSNWYIDLGIKTDKLLVLNTKPDLESMYYGRAFVKGDATLKGYVNSLKIDAHVKSREGTKIYIPLRDVETIGEDDFISFHTRKDYKKNHKPVFRKVYEGLELNLDIDVTPEAEVEIVVDPEFGSKLVARGEGTLLMEIQTEGKFQMWGSYQVLEGNYFFRYLGIIDKKFDVEPGSLLVWNGDPFSADLDIKAVYRIPAVDVSPLIGDALTRNYRVPLHVIIYLKGNLLKPRIEFDIDIPEANSVVRSQIEYVLSDPDKRMLQIIALLYSGTFLSEETLNFNSVAAVSGNLSERLLNVFNTLLQNEKFNVKLNYVPGTQNPVTNVKTSTEVGLTIETRISKRVYINGKVAVPVGRYTNQSVSGDLEAQIWLDKNGNLRLRIFNKRTEVIYTEQEESYTRGIGISYHVEFDTFKELARKFGFIIREKTEKETNP